MATEGTLTKHLVIDCETLFAYGIQMDTDGNSTAQPLNLDVKAGDGRVVKTMGSLVKKGFNKSEDLPYGKTTCAFEVVDGRIGQKIFTIVWPTKEEEASGKKAVVSKKDMPREMAQELIRAGIAPAARKPGGAGVEDEAALKEALKNIEKMIGLGSAKKEIKQNIAIARFNRQKERFNSENGSESPIPIKPISRHMVFAGPPGTGKTTFAREVAKVYKALGFIQKEAVHEVKREDLVAGFVGQTALKTKGEIEKAKGGILFIDEAYALSYVSESSGGSNDFGKEAINTLVAAMENMREDLIVIVAGYTDPMKKFIDSNEGLKSRFMTYINFDSYGINELGLIMDSMLKDRGYTMSDEARAHAMKILEDERVRAKEHFGNGRTVRNLVEMAEKEMSMRLDSEGKLSNQHGLSSKDLRLALTTVTLADIQSVKLEGLSAKIKKVDGMALDSFAKSAPKANNVVPFTPAEQKPQPSAQKANKRTMALG